MSCLSEPTQKIVKIVKIEALVLTAVSAICHDDVHRVPSISQNTQLRSCSALLMKKLRELLRTLLKELREVLGMAASKVQGILPRLIRSSRLVIKKTVMHSQHLQVNRPIWPRNIVMAAIKAIVP